MEDYEAMMPFQTLQMADHQVYSACPGKKTGERGRLARLKRVSAKWLQEHISLGQAGLILRLLQTGERRGKQSWLDTPPARPFLGVRPEEVNTIHESLAQEMTRRI